MSNNYPQITDPQLNDTSLIWDESNAAWRRVTFSDILTLFQANTEESVGLKEANSQYYAPALTGFTVQVNDDSEDTHLIMTPPNTLAAGTIKLPLVSHLRDKQTVLVNCTQQITTLSLDMNGAVAINGAPTALAADDFFELKYDLPVSTWYRIG